MSFIKRRNRKVHPSTEWMDHPDEQLFTFGSVLKAPRGPVYIGRGERGGLKRMNAQVSYPVLLFTGCLMKIQLQAMPGALTQNVILGHKRVVVVASYTDFGLGCQMTPTSRKPVWSYCGCNQATV